MVHVPGAGLLRDSQKWVALAAPLYALAAAAGVRALSKRVSVPGAVPVAAIAAVVLALPDLVWGVAGALKPVQYPPAWRQVAQHLELSKEAGDVAVLPAGMFRRFPYSGDAPVLDPAPRILPRDVLQTGQLVVGQAATVGGEGAARPVSSSFCSRAPARSRSPRKTSGGVGRAHHPGPLGDAQRTLDQLEPIFADDELALYGSRGASHRIPGTVAARPSRPPAVWRRCWRAAG